MFKTERKILDFIEKYLYLIVLVAISVIGLFSRINLLDFVSSDAEEFLLPWYESIKQEGMATQTGDYNLLYQLIILIFTKLPIKPLYAYKWFSIIFDYLLASLVYNVINKLNIQKSRLWATAGYCAVLMSPLVVMNSALWAQCDSIYVFFSILALVYLYREKYISSMIFLGIAFTFKLQTIILLPIFLIVYFLNRKFSILNFLIVPITMVVVNIPALFLGRNILEIFSVYFKQTSTYQALYLNYPSFWSLVEGTRSVERYNLLKFLAIGVTITLIAFIVLYLWEKKIELDQKSIIYLAFLISFTCVLFLPAMHERYGYLYEILSIVIALMLPKTAWLSLGLIGISCITYCNFLFNNQGISLIILTVVNLAIYMMYVYTLRKELVSQN